MAIFKKRMSLDPLVVDRSVVQPEAALQDNVPGPAAPDLEAIAHAAGAREAKATGATIRFGIDPKSMVPREDDEPKDD